jgi:hypothetical protein
LWNIYDSSVIAISLSVMIAFLAWRMVRSEDDPLPLILKLLFALFVPVIISFPILFSSMPTILNRAIISYQAFMVLFFGWLILKNYSPARWLAPTVIVAVALSAGFNMWMNAKNSQDEYAFIASQIKNRGLSQAKILVIKNVDRDLAERGINSLPPVSDEFNVNTSVYSALELTSVVRLSLIQSGASREIVGVPCGGVEDCKNSLTKVRNLPGYFLVAKTNDLMGWPVDWPVIDLEQFTR